MTNEQKDEIRDLRMQGLGYVRIARIMNLSVNTIRSHCCRHGLTREELNASPRPKVPTEILYCRNCGRPVAQSPHRKKKLFCSDACRMKWWNSHPDMVERKAWYDFTCQYCRKKFRAYGNSHRKYCCHECFIADRFGERH